MKRVFEIKITRSVNSSSDVNTFVDLVRAYIKKEEADPKKEITYLEALSEIVKTSVYDGDVSLGIDIVVEALDVLKSFESIPIALKYANEKKMKFDITGDYKSFKNFKDVLEKYVKVLDDIDEQILAKGIDGL